jgi:hypothetical protein
VRPQFRAQACSGLAIGGTGWDQYEIDGSERLSLFVRIADGVEPSGVTHARQTCPGGWHRIGRTLTVFVNAVPTVLVVGAAFVRENRDSHPGSHADGTSGVSDECCGSSGECGNDAASVSGVEPK